jgi:hypothetical protein
LKKKILYALFLFQSTISADTLYREYNIDKQKHMLNKSERTTKEKLYDEHFLRLKEKQLKFILLKRGEKILTRLNDVPYLSGEWHKLSKQYENYLESYKLTMKNIATIRENQ